MQKIVYLSNSRDYTEQGDINENKYFKKINGLLDEGWTVSHIAHEALPIDIANGTVHKESFVAFVLLEKSDEDKK